jgi:HAMP domain-containing protein
MVLAAVLYLRQLNALSDLITEESSEAIQKMGEDKVIDASRSVALQCKLFLESHPFLEKEMFNSNLDFRRLAVQKIGQTGYTSLYQLPEEDNIWRAWAHFDQAVIGQDLGSVQKAMGDHLPAFLKIFADVKSGADSKGYYDFPEKDSLRKKFLVCTPVEGTRYIIAATTFMDEFTQPVKRMQTRAKKFTDRTRNVIIFIVVGTLILIGLVVFLYSYRLTGRIQTLTRIADEISIGDLDATIKVDTRDEIGRLAESIARMQDSIRMSIERLRKRR